MKGPQHFHAGKEPVATPRPYHNTVTDATLRRRREADAKALADRAAGHPLTVDDVAATLGLSTGGARNRIVGLVSSGHARWVRGGTETAQRRIVIVPPAPESGTRVMQIGFRPGTGSRFHECRHYEAHLQAYRGSGDAHCPLNCPERSDMTRRERLAETLMQPYAGRGGE